MKRILLIIFTALMLFSIESVSAEGEICYCGRTDEGSNCHKRTYQYNKDGAAHSSGAYVILGVRHFKETLSNNPNQQYVTAFDDCYGNATANQFCSTLKRFQILGSSSDCGNSSTTYMDINSSTYVYPMAICAFPNYTDNSGVNYTNASKYIYYTQTDIDNAVKNGYCTSSNLLYSAEAITTCEKLVETYTLEKGASNYKISTQLHTAGIQKICQVNISYTVNGENKTKVYNEYDYNGTCTSSNYKLSCHTIGDPTQPGERCYLYSCEADENAGVTEEDKGEEVGFKCTLTNEADSNDKVIISYVDNDKLEDPKYASQFSSYRFYLTRNNEMVTESISDRMDTNSHACPSHIYYDKTDNRWIIFPSLSDVQIFLNDKDTSNGGQFIDHEFIRFSLNNVSDKETLYEDDVNEAGIPNDFDFDPDDYEYEGTYYCGIFGEKTWGYIQMLYSLIRIAIPAAVIILGMIDFMSVVFSGEEKDMKASGQRFLKRVIIGVVFILLPFLLQFIMNLVGFSEDCLGDLINFSYIIKK